MLKLDAKNAIVMIIDVQEKLINAVYNKSNCLKNSAILAKAASALNLPVIITEQYPKGLGYTIEDIKNSITENVEIFEKTNFSALDCLDVKESIEKLGRKQVIIFGIETHICLSQTVTDLIENGYEVNVVKDASGSRTEAEHLAGLERIKDHGGYILTTEIALFELLRGAKHPNFKELQALIK